MRSDRYIEAVLTVIAAALLRLALKDTVPSAYAQPHTQGPQRVVIVGFEGSERSDRSPLPVKLVGVQQASWVMNADLGSPYTQRLPWQPVVVTNVKQGQ
jgi:hypothetical protein